jgi:hypothetical protein
MANITLEFSQAQSRKGNYFRCDAASMMLDR